jgi:hypothetical protein
LTIDCLALGSLVCNNSSPPALAERQPMFSYTYQFLEGGSLFSIHP